MWRSLVLVAALTACAPQATPAPQPEAHPETADAGSSMLPPPWPDGLAARIGEADAGEAVAVPVGQPFAVALVGVPTAGYVWLAEDPPAFLESTGESSGPTTKAQLQPGFTGGNHWEVLSFRATAPGAGTLRLVQRRPWETQEPPSRTFEVVISAH